LAPTVRPSRSLLVYETHIQYLFADGNAGHGTTSSRKIRMVLLISDHPALCAILVCLSTRALKSSLDRINTDSLVQASRRITIGTSRTRQTTTSICTTVGGRSRQNITGIPVNIHLIISRRSIIDVHLRRRCCTPLWSYRQRRSLLNLPWHPYTRRLHQNTCTREVISNGSGSRPHSSSSGSRPPTGNSRHSTEGSNVSRSSSTRNSNAMPGGSRRLRRPSRPDQFGPTMSPTAEHAWPPSGDHQGGQGRDRRPSHDSPSSPRRLTLTNWNPSTDAISMDTAAQQPRMSVGSREQPRGQHNNQSSVPSAGKHVIRYVSEHVWGNGLTCASGTEHFRECHHTY